MPFLTQGKTNWKYILIILVLAVIVGGAILSCQYLFPQFISFPTLKKSTCTQDASSNFLFTGEGKDPCNRSCESDEDCKFECGCQCISKSERCVYTGIVCEAPDPNYGCKCIDNTCKFEYIGTDETTNWKTYRNEEYGFEVKYPENWEFSETLYPKEMELYIFSVGFIPKGEVYWVEGTPGIYPIKIFINKSFPEYIDKEKEEQILVNGKPAIKREGYLGLEYEIAFLQPNSFGYYLMIVNSIQNIKAAGNISEDEATQFNEIFNQMISTFRFLE